MTVMAPPTSPIFNQSQSTVCVSLCPSVLRQPVNTANFHATKQTANVQRGNQFPARTPGSASLPLSTRQLLNDPLPHPAVASSRSSMRLPPFLPPLCFLPAALLLSLIEIALFEMEKLFTLTAEASGRRFWSGATCNVTGNKATINLSAAKPPSRPR